MKRKGTEETKEPCGFRVHEENFRKGIDFGKREGIEKKGKDGIICQAKC